MHSHNPYTKGKIISKGMFGKSDLLEIEIFQLDPFTNKLFGMSDSITKGKLVA